MDKNKKVNRGKSKEGRSNSGIRNYLSKMVNGFQDKEDPDAAFNKDGKIDLQTPQGQKYLARTFKQFDANNDMKLQPDEIYKALKKSNQKTSYGQIYRIMREFDTDKDGEIDFTEYKAMVAALQNGTFDDYDSDEEKEKWENRFNKEIQTKETPQPAKLSQQIVPGISRNDLENALGNRLNGNLKDEAENFVKKKYSSIIRRNKELEADNSRLLQQSENSSFMGQSQNERNLVQKLNDHQKREREMKAMIADLQRQNLELSQQSISSPTNGGFNLPLNFKNQKQYNPDNGFPSPIRIQQKPLIKIPEILPQSMTDRLPSPIKFYGNQSNHQQPDFNLSNQRTSLRNEKYLTKLEAKNEAKNLIFYRISKENLQNQNYCKQLDANFDQSFDRLKRYDGTIAESKMTELSNNMLSA